MKVAEVLVKQANSENANIKRVIFKVVRCHNCHQSSTGGTKVERALRLPDIYIGWLDKVRENCKHASLGKTLRIVVDFYSALFESQPELEAKLFSKYACAPDSETCEEMVESKSE